MGSMGRGEEKRGDEGKGERPCGSEEGEGFKKRRRGSIRTSGKSIDGVRSAERRRWEEVSGTGFVKEGGGTRPG